MADRHYLDQTGLAFFWNKLKNYFQKKLTQTTGDAQTTGDVIIFTANTDNHLELQAQSGATHTTITQILPASDVSTGTPREDALVTEAGISSMISDAISDAGSICVIVV